MRKTRMIYVRCEIEPSGFSGERIFRVPTAEGGKYVGAAPVHYFYAPDMQRLDSDACQSIESNNEGLIQALLIEHVGQEARVVFPGGEMAVIATGQYREDPQKVGDRVPV